MLIRNHLRLSWIIFVFLLVNALPPIGRCAKLQNSQTIDLLVNDDKNYAVRTAEPKISTTTEDHKLYRSALNRLSYETIHRILRDEDTPISRRRQPSDLNYNKPAAASSSWHRPLVHQHLNASRQKRSMTSESQSRMNYKKLSLANCNLTNSHFMQIAQKHIDLIVDLDLSQNFLNWLPVEDFRQLHYLNLAHNQFNRIPLLENSTIITLNLNHNRIKSTVIPINSQLKELFLSANQIENLTDLQFSHLPNLEILDLSCNRLQSLESTFFNQLMYNLKHLNLAFNQLNIIYRQTFYNLFSLNTLLLAGNNISDIDYETFLSLPNLQYLDLSHNRLLGKSIRALQGITGLVVLSIKCNWHLGPYMQEFVASWSLKELDASGTGLCQIPAALAQSVRSLKLTHNSLKMIDCGDLDSYPLLHYLDLSYNHIQEIEDDALGRLEMLETLMLDHNDLYKVPMSLPTSLEHLFLQHNQITELQANNFRDLNNLQTLDLAGNKLLYLPALPLGKLETLNLQSAGIRSISQAIVHTLPLLNDLLLEDNPIKCSDLMGIAEWASNCRLTIKEDHFTSDENEENGQNEMKTMALMISTTPAPPPPPPPSAHIDLKAKFLKMHNFYEKFPPNYCQQHKLRIENQSLEGTTNNEKFKCPTESNTDTAIEANLNDTKESSSSSSSSSSTTEIPDKKELMIPAVMIKEVFGTLNLQSTNDNSSKMMKKRGEYAAAALSLQDTHAADFLLEKSTSFIEYNTKDNRSDSFRINQRQHSDLESTKQPFNGISNASLDYTAAAAKNIVENPRASRRQEALRNVAQITANTLQLPILSVGPRATTTNNGSMALTPPPPQTINSFKVRPAQMKPLNSSKATASATAIDVNAPLSSTSDIRNEVNGHNDNNNENNGNVRMQNINKLNGKPINSSSDGNIDRNDRDGGSSNSMKVKQQQNRSQKQQFQFNITTKYNNNSKQKDNSQRRGHIANTETTIKQHTTADKYTTRNHSAAKKKMEEGLTKSMRDCINNNNNNNTGSSNGNGNYVGNNGNQVIVTSIEYTDNQQQSNSKDNTGSSSIRCNSRSRNNSEKYPKTANNLKCPVLNYNVLEVQRQQQPAAKNDSIQNEALESQLSTNKAIEIPTTTTTTTTSVMNGRHHNKAHTLAELHVQNRHLIGGAPLLMPNFHQRQHGPKLTNNNIMKDVQGFSKTNLTANSNRTHTTTDIDAAAAAAAFDANAANVANYERPQRQNGQSMGFLFSKQQLNQEIVSPPTSFAHAANLSSAAAAHNKAQKNAAMPEHSLIMRKMTITTTSKTRNNKGAAKKTAAIAPQLHFELRLSAEQEEENALLADDANEYPPANYYRSNTLKDDDFESFALEPSTHKSILVSDSRHSTINTPIKRDINTTQRVNLEQQLPNSHQKVFNVSSSNTEHWSDIRSTHNSAQKYQSMLMILIAGVMVLLLILGLIHVFRCRLPWLSSYSAIAASRQHRRPHREHQHNNHHSFLQCHENHYNYNCNSCSLQNLHTTKAPLQEHYFSTTRQVLPPGGGHHTCCSNDRQTELYTDSNNTAATTTASNSTTTLNSSTITVTTTESLTTHQQTTNDDEFASFCNDMQTDSRQLNSLQHLHGEVLPMELLNVNVKPNNSKAKCHSQNDPMLSPAIAAITREMPPTSSRRFTLW